MMSKEYPCVHYEKMLCKKFSKIGITSFCIMGPCPHKTPSNADRIRAMSDEELARWLVYVRADVRTTRYASIGEPAVRANIEWLQQPAEVNDNG